MTMNVRSIVRTAGTALLAAGALAASPATAASWYARGDAGPSISASASGDIFNGTGFGNDFGTGPVVDLAVGASMPMSGIGLRGEFEVGYRPSLVAPHTATNPANGTVLSADTHVRNWTTMVNAYADFDAGIGIKPYLGGGLGIGFNHLDRLTYAFNGTTSATEPGKNKSSFAWSLMAGFSYAMTEAASLDIRYRYLDAGKVESSGVVTLVNGSVSTFSGLSSHLKTHEITVGVRFGF